MGTGDPEDFLNSSGKVPDDAEDVNIGYQDVREELELSGHNLTSVLNNPRETFMDSLYEAAFETEQHPPLEVLVVPQGLREITIQVGRGHVPYKQSTGITYCECCGLF